jgi:ferredoxin
MRVAIIGSGPTGLACLKTILELQKELTRSISVTMYDTADEFGEETKTKLGKSVALKDYFGDAFSYDQNRHTKISRPGKSSNLWASGGLGGFSRVWGATLIGTTERDFFNGFYEDMNANSPLITEGGKRLHSKFEKEKQKNSIHLERLPLKLAVKSDWCTKCGDCLTGCPSDAIWCSSDELPRLQNFKYEKKKTVSMIKFIGTGEISIQSSSMSRVFDKVFVATGPLSTASILYNSNLIEGDYYLDDSQTIFNLYLQKRTKPSREKFALAQASFNLKNKKETVANIQIYPCGETLVKKLPLAKLHRSISPKVLSYLSRYLAAGIAYLPPESSGKIHLKKGQNGELIVSTERNKRRAWLLLRYSVLSFRTLRKLGLLQIPLIRNAGIGEGYHFGKLRRADGLNEIGILEKNGLYVVGAAALREVPIGPITDQLIQETILTVRECFKAF